MQRRRTLAAHRAPEHPAIQVAAGDMVTLGQRDTEWPQFVWATLGNGLGGWIPALLFDNTQGTASALADYDTRELDVEAGEILVLHREFAQWWWAENRHGQTGWVPERVLEPATVAQAP